MKKTLILALMLLSSLAAFSDNGVLVGDVNGDGFITSADVTAIYNFILDGDETCLINGDVNGDGYITSADVTSIYNILLSDLPVVTEYTVNGVSFRMVQVNGGTFMMGNPDYQESGIPNQGPVHQVTLSTFAIGQTEVTQELWVAVMGGNPSWCNGINNASYHSNVTIDFGDNLQRPVENVSWNNCQTFISKLNQMTGKNFRLPTEAEWEYAARGGNKSQGYMYAGSNTLVDVAWYSYNAYNVDINSPDYGTHTVATKQPNELGLYDMNGNVWEMCQDWYSGTYYSESPSTNPQGPSTGTTHVDRGGGWWAYGLPVWQRGIGQAPSQRSNDLGFRLVM